MAATFKILTAKQFQHLYSDAYAAIEPDMVDERLGKTEGGIGYGEVTIPGHGKRGCLVDDVPTWFYDDDDGWQRTPSGETFVRLTASGQRG